MLQLVLNGVLLKLGEFALNDLAELCASLGCRAAPGLQFQLGLHLQQIAARGWQLGNLSGLQEEGIVVKLKRGC